jgi:hypothetical protein
LDQSTGKDPKEPAFALDVTERTFFLFNSPSFTQVCASRFGIAGPMQNPTDIQLSALQLAIDTRFLIT